MTLLDKPTLRVLLTILMYAGVCLFLYPYLTSRLSYGLLFLVVGASVAVSSGLLRCYLTDGDCAERQRQHTKVP